MPTDSDRSEREIPSLLTDRFEQIVDTLDRSTHLLCCLDFDGTLAPIVDDPDAARLPAGTERTLARLQSHPNVTVSIISGRSIRDLLRRIDLSVTLFGNHGLERLDPLSIRSSSMAVESCDGVSNLSTGTDQAASEVETGRYVHPLAEASIPRIETCCGVLDAVLDPIPNARVEHKELTGTVHYRTVPSSARPVCRRLTKGVLSRIGGDTLSVTDGNAIVEFGPAIDWGKGDAVELLHEEHPPGTAILVCGDDTTDEHAFRTLPGRGISVLVGSSRRSHSTYRTESPETLATFLEWLASDGTSRLEEPGTRFTPRVDR